MNIINVYYKHNIINVYYKHNIINKLKTQYYKLVYYK
jgi:hypothetical protein